jgi:2-methylcitrate dehydratase PrpD
MSTPLAPSKAKTAAKDSSLTDYVAGFIVGTRTGDIPKDVAHLGKRSVLDGLGLALAGAASQTGEIARKYLRALGFVGEEGSTVIGSDLRIPARFAAFANGISIHADDFDDTQLAIAKDRVYGLLTHPTAPALPPALAIAERDRRSGADLMLAYQVGVEVECKVAEAIMPRHYQTGFHSTATCGSIGAAAAAAKLLGLDREATRRALAIGATQAGGLRENFGTMTKPFHAGRAAENGLVAAEIAALGFTASPNALEADRGFFRAAGGGFSPEMIDGKLANPWTFAFPGVSIKPHPSGSLTHPGMAVMMELILKHDIKPESVKPDVQAMIEKVGFGVHPEAEAAGFDKMTTLVEVELADGKVVKGQADFGKGSPANPMTDEELSEKFRQCAAWGGLDRERTQAILALAWKIEALADVNDLVKLLRK